MRSGHSLTRLVGKLTFVMATLGLMALGGCASGPSAPPVSSTPTEAANYVIGPGDTLQISVWRSPELSTTVPVRPDGRISTPLDRKSTRLNSSHVEISYAVFCLKK